MELYGRGFYRTQDFSIESSTISHTVVVYDHCIEYIDQWTPHLLLFSVEKKHRKLHDIFLHSATLFHNVLER